MIRKWFKINTCFTEILKSSAASGSIEKKWIFDGCRQFLSSCSLYSSTPENTSSQSVGSTKNQATPLRSLSDPNEKGDAESGKYSDSEESYSAVAETPAKTELFEVKGPNGAAFLIEVQEKDLDEVKRQLVWLKGDFFHFDKAVIEWFTMKCILAAKLGSASEKEEQRLAKVHAISSGSEEVYYGTGKYFFVNSVDRTMRAKRILERLGYKISGILYRFQPKEKVSLNERVLELCKRFIEAVEKLPKVISITHNL